MLAKSYSFTILTAVCFSFYASTLRSVPDGLQKMMCSEVVIMSDKNHNGYADPMMIQRYLRGVDYPCSKEELVEKAKEAGAEEEVIETLEEMPDDVFESPADVALSIGKIM